MDVYKSKNSRYYFEGENLIRIKGEKKSNLGAGAIYASEKSIESLLKKYDIHIRKVKTVDLAVGDKFMDELEKITMDKNQKGGRFFNFLENIENYSIFCSGEIVDIKTKEGAKIELEKELELSDKNDEFKIDT